MEHVSSVHPTGKFPGKVENLKRWSRFPRLEFPNGMSCSIYVSRSLYQFQVHRRAPRRTGAPYDQMEELFTNRKFHFCSHRNFRVFFLNGKRPLFFIQLELLAPGTAFWLVHNWPLGLRGTYITSGYTFFSWIENFSAYCSVLRASILLPPRHPSVFARWQ